MAPIVHSFSEQQSVWAASVGIAAETCFAILNDRQGECRQWARDFFLAYDVDPSGDAMALSNDVAAAYSCGSRFTYGSEELSTSCSDFSHLLNGVTVGISVEYRIGTSAANKTVHPAFIGKGDVCQSVGRFVQEKDGETLIIFALSGAASRSSPQWASVMHIVNQSTTKFSTTIFFCDRKMLVGKSKTPSTFAASAVMCNLSSELITCPVCLRRTDSSAKCFCELPVASPTGALDFSEFRRSGTLNSGTAKSSTSFYFASWDVVFVDMIPSALPREFICITKKTSIQLTTTKAPFEDDVGRSLCDMLRTLGIEGRMSLGRVQGPIGAVETQDDIAQLCGECYEGNQPVVSSGILRSTSSLGDATTHGAGRSQSPPDKHGYDGDSGGQEQHAIPSQVPYPCDTAFPDVLVPGGLVADTLPSPLVSLADLVPTESPPLEVLPCSPADPPLDCVAVGVVGVKDTAKLEKIRRRKESNRLAAAKSNARRKEHLVTLRNDLECWTKRKIELGKKEAELKKCNMELKSQAASRFGR